MWFTHGLNRLLSNPLPSVFYKNLSGNESSSITRVFTRQRKTSKIQTHIFKTYKLLDNARLALCQRLLSPTHKLKWRFNLELLDFLGNIDIILNDFQSLFNSIIKIVEKFIWVEYPQIPGIQSNCDENRSWTFRYSWTHTVTGQNLKKRFFVSPERIIKNDLTFLTFKTIVRCARFKSLVCIICIFCELIQKPWIRTIYPRDNNINWICFFTITFKGAKNRF